MKPLTPLMIRVLEQLAKESYSITCNRLAHQLGFTTGQDRDKHSHNGRAMAPAQRVIHPLVGLRQRGLVGYGVRTDRLSGTAYAITDAGRQWLKDNPAERR